MAPFVLTPEIVTKVLTVVDAGLSSGLGIREPGQMCVEAAVCYALNQKHGDNPTCVHPIIREVKITLNDSSWSSKKVRAEGMRRLAVLQLGTKDISFDQYEFVKKLALMTVKTILPMILFSCGLVDHAEKCKAVTTLQEAEDAASDAASDAARCAARYTASYAASDAANAASDVILRTFATGVENILIEMNVPAVSFLSLINPEE